MSSKLHGLVWEGCAQAGLGISRVALMARLADYSNAEGISWPGIETLRVEIGAKSDTTIKAALTELVKGGWIKKIERKLGGRNLTNLYQINIEKLEFAAAQGRKKIREERAKKKGSRCLPAGAEEKGAKIDPSKIAPSNEGDKGADFDPPNFEGSKIDENSDLTPPKIAPDPSCTADPSLNPTHNACEGEIKPVNQNLVPEYAGQPGIIFPAAEMIGKFPMHTEWMPSPDFRQRAGLWGIAIPAGLNLRAELKSFVDYWIAEGKAFHQTQWEQKFARSLQNAKTTPQRGNPHAGMDPNSTANAAVQRAHAIREAQLRARGEGVEVLGAHAGNLLEPLGDQKRLGPVGPMDCADWEFDQRPDDERL
ncbi:DnaT-like ssDNA-binding domain-containing protein [Lelliottia sp. V89_10]|uniref:DnaT-like ssDNA-binding domain-containing protein n=1 Tax=Lelliottia wanjuensis TaxID=3050585 RepID=UPI00249E17C1|nr:MULTISPECIES: DnaT-like ssDNA-binding domain-containing protein [unclassified Lelliottia]MDI3359744.1 DnaT-like ssDNA-binding domain-containing protein [Lelliottia sp. V89_13]MDK9548702.1 DnaT-like ssDNA-binding domain-containing protein [Lelliottia sp. V89_5]MDK9597334.1 DnaT-like ssDNA-binding domain-containing protein [Lelliottia sp. V89_10]